MRSLVLAAFAAVSLTVSAVAQSANAAQVGTWSLAALHDDAAQVQLRLEYADDGGDSHSSWSSSVPYANAGLSPERLRAPVAPVSFRIEREPGTFACTGSAGAGSGAGQFSFTPNEAFASGLASRGLGRPSEAQALELAIAGATLSFVDLVRGKPPHGTLTELVRVVEHGVTPQYVADLAALGYHGGGDELMRLRDHGVGPTYIRALQAAGYKNLPADELVQLRDHGVGTAFVARLKAHGYANVSVRDLIRLRDSGL